MVSARPPYHYPLGNENSPFIATGYQYLRTNKWQCLYYVIASFTLLPMRFAIFFVSSTVLFILSLIATIGLKDKQPTHLQIVGWRWYVKALAWQVYRVVLFSYGVVRIKQRGRRVRSDLAPICVVAPHSSIFFDCALLYLSGGHPVASKHLLHLPILGNIVRILDPVFLDRFDTKHKKMSMEIVKSRAALAYRKRWKQVVFFPEGLCTNGDVICCFKPGAFLPGLNVQPVTIKTKRHLPLHLPAWTHTGVGDKLTNFFQFLMPWQELEVHYMEPYKPSEIEKSDPELFAYNVQQVMAKHMNIRANDYSLVDAVIPRGVLVSQLIFLKLSMFNPNAFVWSTKLSLAMISNMIQSWLVWKRLRGDMSSEPTSSKIKYFRILSTS